MTQSSPLHIKRNILLPSILLQVITVVAALAVAYSLQRNHLDTATQSRLNSFSEVWRATLNLEAEKIRALITPLG
jgi:hypothetical protein